jgi:hypothetical protein
VQLPTLGQIRLVSFILSCDRLSLFMAERGRGRGRGGGGGEEEPGTRDYRDEDVLGRVNGILDDVEYVIELRRGDSHDDHMG